ncbi:MAG: type I DNA topoisomerase [Bacteroidales bacterium]|nr:type I DNA topoisomerase [Bacteroidales bacterium]
MGKNLVIVESPGKIKKIQKFLGGEKSDYIVEASRGHIRDLSEKDLSIDIKNGFEPKYMIPADKKSVVSKLKKLAADAPAIYLASDEDREGEAISWHLFETLGLKKENTRRIVFHEITETAVLDSLKNPRDIDMNLVDAQQARRVLDRLVGFELSPVLWRKVRRGLSAGRVQSVALRLVVDREREILSFEKELYYRIEALFKLKKGGTLKTTLEKKFKTAEEAEAFLRSLIGLDFSILDIQSKEVTRYAAPPFTTSTLQQEAARRYHFSVSQTMSIAQKLYEEGLITYMRTDSVNLSNLALSTAKKFITEQFGAEYSRPCQYQTKGKGAQEAHEAIRPTYIDRTSINGTAQEKKLYDLIWKRTLASQMAPATLLRTEVQIGTEKIKDRFGLVSDQVRFDGFLKIYRESTDDEEQEEWGAPLPNIHVGDLLDLDSAKAAGKYTQPPFRYSEASLVKKLEELGIGRPSTYAPTISTLTKARGYIVIGDKEGEKLEVKSILLKNGNISYSVSKEVVGAEKRKLLPQEIGMLVTDYLVEHFSDILDYGFTAGVEEDFDKIAHGQEQWKAVIGRFYAPFHQTIDRTMAEKSFSKREDRLLGQDEQGRPVVVKYGQFGAYVQIGEGEDKMSASLSQGQLMESITLEEALKLFLLPRTVGSYKGIDIIATKGRFGPYLKYGDKNVSLPRGAKAESISLEKCIEVIDAADNKPAAGPIAVFEGSGIQVLNGRYGPYIKQGTNNYRIPHGTDAATLTEADCQAIIAGSQPTASKTRRFTKKK